MALLLALSIMLGCGGGAQDSVNSKAVSKVQLIDNGRASAGQLRILSAASEEEKLLGKAAPHVIKLRASASMFGGTGARVEVRFNGLLIAAGELTHTTPVDYSLALSGASPDGILDIVFSNATDAAGATIRTLTVELLAVNGVAPEPGQAEVLFDAGLGETAFDGHDTSAAPATLTRNGALRFKITAVPSTPAEDRKSSVPNAAQASRFLQQATFGPTRAEIDRLTRMSLEAWLDEQMRMPSTSRHLNHVEAKFSLGSDYLPPDGPKYTPDWVGQKFWASASTGQDQLRQRVAFALGKIFVVSQSDANMYWHNRAYAHYVDTLHNLAFGNYRQLLEEVALSPVMGIYLSHLRNGKENPSLLRQPDENFARELMQLFSIGLHELNPDGTQRLNAVGAPIETYDNKDVMAMARVFTGWSWGFDDADLNDFNFQWRSPNLSARGEQRVEIRPMKAYPGQSSESEKQLFQGRVQATTIVSQTSPRDNVKIALDALFGHPNVGPFIGRQLIQQLVTSNPSPAYVARVAAAFNSNAAGVRGDLGNVVRAILLDPEARGEPGPRFGKVREPILRVTQWMRAFGAKSASGEFLLTDETVPLGQRPYQMPSVFGFFRPAYTPPNSGVSGLGMVAPEMQIINESTLAHWINSLELMLVEGMGWHGTRRDVTTDMADLAALSTIGPTRVVDEIDILLFAGRMSPGLRQDILTAMAGVPEEASNRHTARAKSAVFVAMASPEYFVQR